MQDNFSRLHDTETTDLNFGKWGELFEQLASPQFWEYKANTQQWTHKLTEEGGATPGGR